MTSMIELISESEENEKLPHSIFVKISAVYNSLKPAEMRAANVLLGSFSKVRGLNISEFAQLAGCSEATVFRFVKKLGYESFTNFKADCLQEKLTSNVMNNFTTSDTPISILRKTFATSIQILEDTLATIDEEKFNAACDALKRAKKIVSFGTGDAAANAEIFHSKLLRINKDTYTSVDLDFIDVICSQLTENDVLVCFSHSGATRKVVQVAKLAKKCGAMVIAITNYPLSQLAKAADIVLFTASFAESVEGEIISKRLPEMCIAESLFISLVLGEPHHETALKKSLESVKHNKY